MIVVEGYDCSGKTTLVEKLHRMTGLARPHAGGPPRDHHHVMRCLARCAARMTQPVIQDRVTQISESVYGMLVRPNLSALAMSRIPDLRLARLVVYCRPPAEVILAKLKDHELKAHDTIEHLELVQRHAETMIKIYDTVIHMVRQHADVFLYDYTVQTSDNTLKAIIEEIKP